MKISTLIKAVAVFSGLLILLTIFSIFSLNSSFKDERSAVARQAEFKQLGFDLVNASDYLTNEARYYSVSGEKTHFNNYMTEVNVTKTRDHVVERLEELGAPKEELDLIAEAKQKSDALVKTETEAFAAVDAKNMEHARQLMYGADYDAAKSTIMKPIDQFQDKMNSRAAAEAKSAQQQANTWLNVTMTVLIVLAVFISFTMILFFVRIVRPVRDLNVSIENLAGSEGDLTVRLPVKGKDELGEIAASFNKMVTKLQDMLIQVVEGISSLSQSSREVSSSTNEIAMGNQQQAAAVDNVNEIFESIAEGMQSVAKSSEEAAAITMKAVGVANDGGQVIQSTLDDMAHMSEKMKDLAEKSNLIGDIVEMIDDIAEQTNLLALNAAIEAARAGESGKGFAVVADEVRKLAERSGEATKRIVAHIKTIKQNTEEAVIAVRQSNEMAQRAGTAFKDIVSMVKTSSNYITDIAAASEEQSVQSSDVYKTIQSMAAITEQTSAGAEENAAAAQNLTGLANTLERLVGTFKV
ncbi:methyl-accepting chemotaxis protein [Cohnella soli]|uniref:Methyl-accepting chemotaxis protein n=1 Tax=Cohnella soli TaxID=425005 RepID=A0ABW0I1M2_9BACL